MKRILFSLLAGTALIGASAALAADLPSRRPPAPYVAVPTFTWTGFYIGVNAGGAFSTGDRDNDDTFGVGGFGAGGFSTLTVPAGGGGTFPVTPAAGFFNTNRDNDRSGFAGGGQIGFNYQVGQVVWGIEADIQGTSFGNNNRNNGFGFGGFADGTLGTAVAGGGAGVGTGIAPGTGAAGVGTANVAFFNNAGLNATRRNIDWFGTVRGRLGYAWDRALLYVTGGVAFTDNGDNNRNNIFFGAGGFGFGGGAGVPAAFFTSPAAAAAGAAVAPNVFLNNRRNSNDVGFAVGGGLEYAFTNNWTAKIEGLYVSFDDDNRNNGFGNIVGVANTGAPITRGALGGFGFTNNRDNNNDFVVVRAGLNYKFW